MYLCSLMFCLSLSLSLYAMETEPLPIQLIENGPTATYIKITELSKLTAVRTTDPVTQQVTYWAECYSEVLNSSSQTQADPIQMTSQEAADLYQELEDEYYLTIPIAKRSLSDMRASGAVVFDEDTTSITLSKKEGGKLTTASYYKATLSQEERYEATIQPSLEDDPMAQPEIDTIYDEEARQIFDALVKEQSASQEL